MNFVNNSNEIKYMRVIKAQSKLIDRAKCELEFHIGDYAFCDGDEYQEYLEALEEIK